MSDRSAQESETGSRPRAFSRATDTLPTLLLLGRTLNDRSVATGGAPAPVNWPLLAVLASHHLVTPALAPRLAKATGAPLDRELRQYFEVLRTLNRERNQRIKVQLGGLVTALNATGIVPILLKGAAHLILGLYEDDADRVIGDIDLLVAEEERDAALAILRELGYSSYDEDVDHAHMHHYAPVAREDGEVWVELHKLASPYCRALPTPALIRRARRVPSEIGAIAVPSPDDLLVHNIVHSQRHKRGVWAAEFSLRDAYDLVLLARHFRDELDWSRLAARIAAGVGRHSAGFYVRRAHRLFGEPPPRLPWPVGARIVDWRWGLHVRGKMRWLQRASRLIAHELQLLSQIVHNPAWRRRPARRLLDPRWYRQHLRRVRGVARG